jgi:hypothetical protein
MHTTTTLTNQRSKGTPSIAQAVKELRMEFSCVKSELHDAKRENDRLKNELAKCGSLYQALSDLEISKLRRRVTFYCHPDRGGDGELMSTLNALFDCLLNVCCHQNEELCKASENGGVS